MSYNTRRSANYGGPAQQQRQNPQMNRGLQNNFVSGGQMPQQPAQQQQQARAVPPQQVSTPVKSILKNNAQVKVEPNTPQYQTYSTQPTLPQTPQQQPQQPPQQIQQPQLQQQPIQAQQPPVQPQQPLKMDVEVDGEENGEKKKPWKTGVKLSKKQRRERRNKRIRKLVRPKSALMVLNELVGPVNFKDPACAQPTLESCPTVELEIAGKNFRASATSKSAAKQKAAEQALKSIIANKIKLQQQKTDPDGDTDMKPAAATGAGGEEEDGEDSSWCQLASFALFKLIDSWQHEGDFMPPHLLTTAEKARKPTAKPAKSLPANAVQLHPLMLFRQMRPDATVDDVGATGVSPNSIYTVKITVDGEEIFGTGPNKKTARKICAQIAMEKLYDIKYPRVDFTADLSVAK